MASQNSKPQNVMQVNRKRKFDNIQEDSVLYNAPTDLDVSHFVEARISELEAMSKAANTVHGNSGAMQRLPRHMRRRAASHNVKRLPRRVRELAEHQMKAYPPNKKKRPSRKHRRRPKNLLQDYARRQRKFVWLESHIWHAKRFHMIEKWGYKLANFPNDKGHRACYRANVHHCMLWDMSYLCCISLEGSEQDLCLPLQKLMNKDVGLTVGAKYYLDGTREGSAILYKHDSYPYSAIGVCKFMWKPKTGDDDVKRELWLWVHPAVYQDVMEQLVNVCNATKVENGSSSAPLPQSEVVMEDDHQKGADVKVHVDNHEASIVKDQDRVNQKGKKTEKPMDKTDKAVLENPVYQGENVTISSLKDTLCRFRLSGPLSQCILKDILHQADVQVDSKSADVQEANSAVAMSTVTTEASYKWWQRYYSGGKAADSHKSQFEEWGVLSAQSSPSDVRSHSVMGLTVRDPRIFLSLERNNPWPTPTEIPIESSISTWKEEWSSSALWDSDVRKAVKETKINEQEMNKLRSSLLVPGSQLDLGFNESRVPIILIQNPGAQSSDTTSSVRHNQGSGWDIILPGGWSMAFWIGLVYRGARVGGLKELQQVDVENGILHFPVDYPDTTAGKAMSVERKMEEEGKYNRMPPAKRPNYIKLGVQTPFHCPWEHLVKEWLARVEKEDSDKDCEMGSGEERGSDECFYVLRLRSALSVLDKCVKKQCGVDEMQKDSKLDMSCIVPVRISMINKGTPTAKSLICVPTEADLDSLEQDSKFGGPCEPHHVDNSKKFVPTVVKTGDAEKDTKSKDLKAVDHCSRCTMGYLVEGGFQYTHGKGSGLGYVTLPALLSLLKQQNSRKGKIAVLIRSTVSFQYRFAWVEIVT